MDAWSLIKSPCWLCLLVEVVLLSMFGRCSGDSNPLTQPLVHHKHMQKVQKLCGVRKAQCFMYNVWLIVDMFWLLNSWTCHLSANPRKAWHKNNIAQLFCYWHAFDFASPPMSADKFMVTKISLVLLKTGLYFVSDKVSWKIILFNCFWVKLQKTLYLIIDH